MEILILSHADTSIKYFLTQHVADYLRCNSHSVSFQHIASNYDICLFSENSTSLRKLTDLNVAKKYVVLDPKMNSTAQIHNIEHSDGAIVSSIEQAERALKYQRNIVVQPWFRFISTPTPKINSIGKDESCVNIVYHGNKVHLEAMRDTLAPALKRLSRERSFVFKALYNIRQLGIWKEFVPKGVHIEHIQWDPETYLGHIASADIGVLPNFLPTGPVTANYLFHKLYSKSRINSKLNVNYNDYLHRYKFTSNSGRLYEYALLGKPIVAEPTLSISQDIEHEKSGFLALSAEGWYRHLLTLIDNDDLRKVIGHNLKESFFKNHNKEFYLENIMLFLDKTNKGEVRLGFE